MNKKITTIYEKFRQPLFRFLRYKVNDEHTAEDLLHEVFIKATRSLDGLRDGEKIQSWLYAIASNTVKDYYRKMQIELTDETDVAVENEMNESVIDELACCLEDFLMILPQTQREVLKSIYFDELTLLEFAEQKNMNLSTVKSHAKRAKTAFKKLFDACCHFKTNGRGEIIDFCKKPTDAECSSSCLSLEVRE